MTTIVALLDEMASIIDDAVNANGDYPVQVVGRRVYAPTPPAIDMWWGNGGETRDTQAAGFGDVNGSFLFTVRARVAASDNIAEQELLYRFGDDTTDRCVAVALMDDQSLNGLASSVEVLGPTEPIPYQDVAGQPLLLGFQWRVEVLAVTS